MANKEFEQAKERREMERMNRARIGGDMITKSLTTGLIDDADINRVYLGDICDRHKNDFIVSDKKLQPLIVSIRKSGVGQPILLTNIDEQIINLKETIEHFVGEEAELEDMKERLVYLSSQKEQGKIYVLVSGHRRFRACKYLFVEDNMNYLVEKGFEPSLDNFEEWYEVLIKQVDESRNSFLTLIDDVEDYSKTFEMIPALVQRLSQEKEHSLYEDTNLTQREISTFEILTKVKERIDKELESEDAEEFMSKYLPNRKEGSHCSMAELSKAYIKIELGLENISLPSIRKNLKIIENAKTPKLFEMILNGQISINDAEVLSRKDNLDKQEELLERVANGLPMFEQGENNSDTGASPADKILKSALAIEKAIKDIEKNIELCEYSASRKDQSKKSNRERMLKKLKSVAIEEFIKKIN